MINLSSPDSSTPTSMSQARRRGHIRTAAIGLAVLVGFWYLVTLQQPTRPSILQFRSDALPSHSLPKTREAHDFWNALATAIAKGKPSFEKVRYLKDTNDPWAEWKTREDDAKRPDRVEIEKYELEELRRAHKTAVTDLRALGPRLPFVKGTRGIVTTCGLSGTAIQIASLRMLRLTGSKLPVELWLYNQREYEEFQHACEHVFPAFDATCRIMKDYLPSQMDAPLEITNKFMYKLYALLFSSFEHALFMDIDLFPVSDPDSIFITEPFVSKGFILWPDHWAATDSKYFYDIIGLEPRKVSERATTESGAMVVNKNTHAEALLLAAFYNYWGPNHYFPLIYQGAIGEGDKDTYVPAIEVYGLPYYHVSEPPTRLGYRCSGKRRAVASGQHHPYDDWLITSNEIWRNDPRNDLADAPEPRILFVHNNMPKCDAVLLLDWAPAGWLDQQRCDDGKGKAHRIWGPKEMTILKYGWDVEKAVWDSVRWTACTFEPYMTTWVNGSIFGPPRPNVCRDIEAFYTELLPDEIYDPSIPRNKHVALKWGARLDS